jgi:eukaryotic-like serine/threonine-protein kinase
MTAPWADHLSWNVAWKALKELTSGGQASAKLAECLEGGQQSFLKVLNRQRNTERRARFFREAATYASFDRSDVPRLIESNAQHFGEEKFSLYIALEHIDGCTLSERVTGEGTLSLSRAIAFTLKHIETISFLHAEGIVHRDIKPDNVMLRNRDCADPVLVDFGIAFRAIENEDFKTELHQEIGNRFLRLPEFMAGSYNKRDPRSDLSFGAGLFFYAMTAEFPSLLTDAQGRMPHQRPSAAESLRSVAGRKFLALMGFFDRAFSQRISGRFSDAREMLMALRELDAQSQDGQMSTEDDDLAAIVAALESDANKRLVQLKSVYDKGMNVIREIHGDIAAQVSPTYVSFQTGYVNFNEGMRNVLGFQHFSTQEQRFAPHFFIKEVGDEIAILVDGNPFYRTDIQNAEFGDDFRRKLKRLYLDGLRKLIETSSSAGSVQE